MTDQTTTPTVSEAQKLADAAVKFMDYFLPDSDPPVFLVPDEIDDVNGFTRAFEDLDKAVSALRAMPEAQRWRPTHRHCKGGEYRHLGRAHIQTDIQLRDMDAVQVYEAEDGTLWCRRAAEFEERFSALPAPPPQEVK